MNTGIFAGRLGADCEQRVTPSGKDVANFDLAVDVRGGPEDTKTLWVRCALWGEHGKRVAQYLRKGKSVTVLGNIDVRTYESKKDGKTHAQMTCNVRELTLQGGGEQREGASGNAQPMAAHKMQGQAAPAAQGDFDDDIPFD